VTAKAIVVIIKPIAVITKAITAKNKLTKKVFLKNLKLF